MRVTPCRRQRGLAHCACLRLQPRRFGRRCANAAWTGLQPCRRKVRCRRRFPHLLGVCFVFSVPTLVRQAFLCTRAQLQPSRRGGAPLTSTCGALAPCVHNGFAQGIGVSSRLLQLEPFACKPDSAVAPDSASELQVPPPRTAALAADVRHPRPSGSELEPLEHAPPPWFFRPSAPWCTCGTLNETIQYLLHDGELPHETGGRVFKDHLHISHTSHCHQERSSGSQQIPQLNRWVARISLIVVLSVPSAFDCIHHHERRARWAHHKQASCSQSLHHPQCSHEATLGSQILGASSAASVCDSRDAELVERCGGQPKVNSSTVNGCCTAEQIQDILVPSNIWFGILQDILYRDAKDEQSGEKRAGLWHLGTQNAELMPSDGLDPHTHTHEAYEPYLLTLAL